MSTNPETIRKKMKKTEKVKNKRKNGLDGKAQQNVKKEQLKIKINVKRNLQVCENVEAKKINRDKRET